MIVFHCRGNESVCAATSVIHWITVVSLHAVPPIVLACRGVKPTSFNFLVFVLSHVGNIEIAVKAIERKPPRIPEPIRPDFRPGLGIEEKRIIGRDAVWYGAGFDINA